jgi:hypothetical protein
LSLSFIVGYPVGVNVNIDGVYVPGEGYCKVAPGTEMTQIKVFAGSGTKTVFRDAPLHALLYGGNPENWQKVRGEAILICCGRNRRAEIHWAEEKSVGFVKEKFKGWLEE